jgi:RimJ/RimL family protein N-acetyltransferase
VQQLTNVDYYQNLAIVALVPGATEEEIIALAQYFLDPKSLSAEVAFIVHDDWQQKGMGSLMLDYLIQVAASRGVRRFDAKVLPENNAMLAVFQNCGHPVRMEYDGDEYSIAIDIQKPLRTGP